MRVVETMTFDSPPVQVKKAIQLYVADRYPQALGMIHWDPSGRHAKASYMGASGELSLSGTGPTTLEVDALIRFPASLLVTKATLLKHFREAVRDIRKSAP